MVKPIDFTNERGMFVAYFDGVKFVQTSAELLAKEMTDYIAEVASKCCFKRK